MRVAMILNSFPEISEKILLNQGITGVELDVYASCLKARLLHALDIKRYRTDEPELQAALVRARVHF
jgi:hypothetical protein